MATKVQWTRVVEDAGYGRERVTWTATIGGQEFAVWRFRGWNAGPVLRREPLLTYGCEAWDLASKGDAILAARLLAAGEDPMRFVCDHTTDNGTRAMVRGLGRNFTAKVTCPTCGVVDARLAPGADVAEAKREHFREHAWAILGEA